MEVHSIMGRARKGGEGGIAKAQIRDFYIQEGKRINCMQYGLLNYLEQHLHVCNSSSTLHRRYRVGEMEDLKDGGSEGVAD